ncbi:MAG: type leader peptidase [Bacteroidetes bacterium]|nr:type leader peptidase [Bacteroidota bacterium]
MSLLIDLLLLSCLGVIAFQDFRERQVSWIPLVLLFVSFGWKGLLTLDFNSLLAGFIFNAAFILFQLLMLTLWMSIRNKKWTNIIDVYLGLGDILFFVALSTAFAPFQFVVFYSGSMTITVIGVMICRLLSVRTNPEIPLAGSMAAVMMICLTVTGFVHYPDFHDPAVLSSFL